jgi:LacI family transcriptional regulator
MTDKKQRKVTSRQVAQLAGVSQTTVSFVLNNVERANISPETRRKVLQVAQELNYVPDVTARSLARGHGNNIALVLEQPHQQVYLDEYIPKILTGIHQITRSYGFRILFEWVEDITQHNVFTDLLHSKEADGIIVNFNGYDEQTIQQTIHYTQQGLHIVTLDNIHQDVYSVTVDKLSGVRLAIQHLIELGHERIACISYAPPGNFHADNRLRVFRETLENAHVVFDESLVRYGAFDPETGYSAMKSLLQNTPLPTAVFGMNDVMAMGALTAIHEHGLRVPDDIAVVGFDDIRLARYTTPSLTTIMEPDVEHGRNAAEMLIALVTGKTPPEKHITLNTELVIRESCGAGAKKRPT